MGTAWLFCHQIGQPIPAEDVFGIIAAGHLVPYASTRWRSPPQIRGSGPCVGKKTKRTRKMPGRPRSLSSTTAPPPHGARLRASATALASLQCLNKYKLAFRLSVRSHKASQHIDYNLLDLLHFFHPHRKTKPCLHNV